MTSLVLQDRAASPRSGVARRLWGALVQRLARRAAEPAASNPTEPLAGLPHMAPGLLETSLLLRN